MMARRELIAACGLIGALGGALFGAVVAPPHSSYRGSWEAILGFTLCTAVSATLLGLVLARRRSDDAFDTGGRAVAFSLVFGAFNAALMVCGASLFHGRPGGGQVVMVMAIAAVVGLICAVPFIPAIVAVAVTAHDVSARSESVAERAQRRRVPSVAAVSLALAGILVPINRVPLQLRVPPLVTSFALLIIVTMLAMELLAWRSRQQLKQVSIDYGVGDEVVVTRVHDETYRTDVVLASVKRGSREMADAIVRRSLWGHVLALAVAMGALAIQLR